MDGVWPAPCHKLHRNGINMLLAKSNDNPHMNHIGRSTMAILLMRRRKSASKLRWASRARTYCKPVSLSDTPIKQGSVALARVCGRDDGTHVDHVSTFTKVQPSPCERYVFASVDNVPRWALAFADQELHFVLGNVEDLCCNPQFVEHAQPLAFERQTPNVLVALLDRPEGPCPNILRLGNFEFIRYHPDQLFSFFWFFLSPAKVGSLEMQPGAKLQAYLGVSILQPRACSFRLRILRRTRSNAGRTSARSLSGRI